MSNKKKARSTCKYVEAEELEERGEAPKRNADGEWVFKDAAAFRPRLSPEEVLQAGAFGGGYYRPIDSGVTGTHLSGQHKEFEWASRVPESKLTKCNYDASVNKYGVNCGADLQQWEEKGWMSELDPYGWFQWYCRFFEGRRTTDDERQIGRWSRCAGKTGRWRNNLIKKVAAADTTFDDASVSPVVRQTLLHWAYELNEKDFKAARK